MERFPYKLIGGGAALLAVTAALGWGGFSMAVRGQMKQQARLMNKTDTWKIWQELTIPIYIKFYFFNITNAKEMSMGEKPKVRETGPYVYKEYLHKEDILFDKGNDTLTYRQIRSYVFMPELSDGHLETDLLTILNVPFLGVAKIANELPEMKSMLSTVDSTLSDKAELLYVTHPVKELLFDGYSTAAYGELMSDPLVQNIVEFKVPDVMVEDGKYGLFKNKNNSDDGFWEIHAARNKSYLFGKIIGWNDMPSLPYWKGDPCNDLNGTDGIIFQPFLKNTTVLYTFGPDICRSMKLTFEMDHMVDGLDAFRYRTPKDDLYGPEKNINNTCFCPYDDLSKCKMNGIMNLAPCMEGNPLLVSQPHFYGADPEIIDSVDGLMPDRDKHETYYDLNPLSGMILHSARRLQYSMELTPYPGMPTFEKVSKAYVPVFWTEETIDGDSTRIAIMKFFAAMQEVVDTVRWGLSVIAVALVLGGIVVALTRRSSTKVDRITLIQ